MAILHSENWFDDIRLEVVDGDDIMLSYKNNSKVSSCMSNSGRWKRTKFYSYVPKMSLIRAMRDKILMLRALRWTATEINSGKEITVIGKLYHKTYNYDYCPSWEQIPSHPEIQEKFATKWQEFGTHRTSARTLVLDVLPHELDEYPMSDQFRLLTENKDKLYNRREHGRYYELSNHETGKLRLSF